MGVREERELACVLTEGEIQARKDQHYEVSRTLAVFDEEKKAWLSDFRVRCKPHKEREKELRTQIDTKTELRKVECEWRDSLVNGGDSELVRLDTGEVIDTLSENPEDDAPEGQERLPFSAAKPAPELRCTAVDVDGVAYAITAEQADSADLTMSVDDGNPPLATLKIDGVNRRIMKVLRGTACDHCGIVPPFHRPECEGMQADDAAPDSYDRNDTAAVAAKISEGAKPNDAPLTRGVETATAKPRRKNANGTGKAAH